MLGADDGLLPTALVATTVKVYSVPLVSPVTVQLVSLFVQVWPSGLDVNVKAGKLSAAEEAARTADTLVVPS